MELLHDAVQLRVKAVVFDFAETPRWPACARLPRLAGHSSGQARLAGQASSQTTSAATRRCFELGVTEAGLHGPRAAQVPRAVGQPRQSTGGRAGAEVLRSSSTTVEREVARTCGQRRPGSMAGDDDHGRWPTRCTSGCGSSGRRCPDGSATARAIDYSLNRWMALTRFLDDGDLPIDNNWVRTASGRSRWGGRTGCLPGACAPASGPRP